LIEKEHVMTELGYSHGTTAADTNDRALAKVRDALSGLRYGEVTVVVQDGVVVQVERTEKVRITRR
jgi:hypothetical protein